MEMWQFFQAELKSPQDRQSAALPGTFPLRPSVRTAAPQGGHGINVCARILEGKLADAAVNVFHLIGDGGAGRISFRPDYFFINGGHYTDHNNSDLFTEYSNADGTLADYSRRPRSAQGGRNCRSPRKTAPARRLARLFGCPPGPIIPSAAGAYCSRAVLASCGISDAPRPHWKIIIARRASVEPPAPVNMGSGSSAGSKLPADMV